MKNFFKLFINYIKKIFNNRFFKLLVNDTKKTLKNKFTYIFIGLILIVHIGCLIIPYIVPDYENNYKSSYGINEYNTIEELSDRILQLEETYKSTEEQLALDIKNEDLTISETKNAKINLKTASRQILTYKYLYEHKIEYSRYQDYGFLQTLMVSKYSGLNSTMGVMFFISYIIGFITLLRAAIVIPSEIKDGQYKLLFTLPVNRYKYLIYKCLFIILQSAALMIISSIVAAVFYGVLHGFNDVLVFATADYAFGLSYFLAVLFILLFFIITISIYAITAFCISILINNRIFSLILSLLIIYITDIPSSLIELISKGSSKYLLTVNFNPLNAFIGVENNSVFMSLLIVVLYLAPLIAVSLIKFKKQDIR